jgi:hypothetical protein
MGPGASPVLEQFFGYRFGRRPKGHPKHGPAFQRRENDRLVIKVPQGRLNADGRGLFNPKTEVDHRTEMVGTARCAVLARVQRAERTVQSSEPTRLRFRA